MADFASPLESRVGAVLRRLNVLDGRLDRDALKAMKVHLLQILRSKEEPATAETALLLAFERYSVDGELDALVSHAEVFVHSILAEADIGTQFVGRRRLSCAPVAASGTATATARSTGSPVSPLRSTAVGDGSHARLTGHFARTRSLEFMGAADEVRTPPSVHSSYVLYRLVLRCLLPPGILPGARRPRDHLLLRPGVRGRRARARSRACRTCGRSAIHLVGQV